MKTLLPIYSGIILLLFSSAFIIKDAANFSEEKIEVYFSNKMNFNDLVKMKLDLSEKQINVVYQQIEFDDKDKLKFIKFKVFSEGSYRGSGGTADLETGYGFIIDRDPKALFYFQVGVRK